jgi:hypothetical protein
VEFLRDFRLLVYKLSDEEHDIRHRVLDVSDSFTELAQEIEQFPQPLRIEVQEIAHELDLIKPLFPSHRETSILFDREGLGQLGRERAHRIAARMVAVARSVEAGAK